MQKVQNILSCLILRAPCHQNCTPLLHSNSTCSEFRNEIKHKTACICYIAVTCSAPLSFWKVLLYFTVLPALPPLCQTHACSSPTSTHNFHTFSHFGPHIWNNLPQDIRHSATLSSFNTKLKTFLVEYFSWATLSFTTICLYNMCVHACVCICVCVCASFPVMF